MTNKLILNEQQWYRLGMSSGWYRIDRYQSRNVRHGTCISCKIRGKSRFQKFEIFGTDTEKFDSVPAQCLYFVQNSVGGNEMGMTYVSHHTRSNTD